jgi:N-methylhydantoinase A
VATRIAVDVGGTFTDLVFYDDRSGEIRVGKESTTPSAPEEGVLAVVTSAVPKGRLAAAEYFLHGTTVGLNSLLTRTGAVVGLLATRGFRDILEVRRGDRSVRPLREASAAAGASASAHPRDRADAVRRERAHAD